VGNPDLPADHQSVYRRVTSVGTRVSRLRAEARLGRSVLRYSATGCLRRQRPQSPVNAMSCLRRLELLPCPFSGSRKVSSDLTLLQQLVLVLYHQNGDHFFGGGQVHAQRPAGPAVDDPSARVGITIPLRPLSMPSRPVSCCRSGHFSSRPSSLDPSQPDYRLAGSQSPPRDGPSRQEPALRLRCVKQRNHSVSYRFRMIAR
jgi:hypothetical protein